jgi:hypothetical protein
MAYPAPVEAGNLQQAHEVTSALRDEIETLALGTEVEGLAAPDNARWIAKEHLYKGRPVASLRNPERVVGPLPEPSLKEVRVILRNVGIVDPDSI